VSRVAGWLRSAGLRVGDRIAILLRNRVAYLEVVFGAARMGGIGVPINLRLTGPEIAFQIDDCRPAAIFFERGLLAEVERALALCEHPPPLRVAVGGDDDRYETELAYQLPVTEAWPVSTEDAALLMYTSGTTGSAKGALLPHRKSLFNALNAVQSFGIRSDDRVLIAAPLFHSLGLQILALPLLYAGGSLILHAHFEPDAVWDTVEEKGIRYFGGVPAMHQRLYDSLETRGARERDFSQLRFIFSAGSALSVELIEKFRARGLVVLQGYGQTETSTLCCLTEEDWFSRAGSVGRSVRHALLRVISLETIEKSPAQWRDAPTGVTGEIVVRGPIRMIGYWERPEETSQTLLDGWIRTGDLGQLDPERYLTLTGRAREMLISGGENVYPAEIEAVYREHPSIREIAIVAIPDERWGEVPRAHILLSEGAQMDVGALRAWGRERLADFKLPRQFIVESSLPRTASGKIRKHLLRPLD
jgi:fatty-acyl-CoA synthase